MKTYLVTMHVGGALLALVCGILALIYQNGGARHRLLGKLYLLGWTLLFISGLWIGAMRPGISAFEVLTWVSMFFVVRAYSHVLRRRTLGRIWLRRHYSDILISMAGLVVATANQTLPRLGLTYPMWVFWIMCATPTVVVPLITRRLDRRYGFARAASAPTHKVVANIQ